MKYNLIIFGILIFLLYATLEALNFFVAGFPSYKHPRINISISDLISDKSFKIKNYDYKDFLRVYSEDYKKLNYTGRIKKILCGPYENGKYNLIFKTDRYGFRENKDERYSKSDVVIIGDSFTMSNCINKPYDLKSQLKKVNSSNSYLNLGILVGLYPGSILLGAAVGFTNSFFSPQYGKNCLFLSLFTQALVGLFNIFKPSVCIFSL